MEEEKMFFFAFDGDVDDVGSLSLCFQVASLTSSHSIVINLEKFKLI